MEIFLTILLLVVGLVLIIKGGDFFVDAASWIAEVSGIPKLIVGATVVSLATTLPELFVSIFAAIDARAAEAVEAGTGVAYVDMSIGNAVGSVTANLGLILAIALIAIPTVIRRKDYIIKMVLMLSASAVIVIFSLANSEIGVVPSVLLLIIFALAIWDNVHAAVTAVKSGAEGTDEKPEVSKKIIIINILKFIGGAAAIVGGANLLVNNGASLARMMNVPERVISVTLLAVGTSLPELVTTITSIAKKQASLSAGNILGANIIDLTLILPICALVSGQSLPCSANVRAVDLPACLIIGVVASVPTLITKKFARWQGILLLVLYAAYMVITCFVV